MQLLRRLHKKRSSRSLLLVININRFDITKKKSGDGPQTNTGRVQKMNKQNNKKLTMVTVNGVTKFVRIAPDADGKTRVKGLNKMFNIRRGDCVTMGR